MRIWNKKGRGRTSIYWMASHVPDTEICTFPISADGNFMTVWKAKGSHGGMREGFYTLETFSSYHLCNVGDPPLLSRKGDSDQKT